MLKFLQAFSANIIKKPRFLLNNQMRCANVYLYIYTEREIEYARRIIYKSARMTFFSHFLHCNEY